MFFVILYLHCVYKYAETTLPCNVLAVFDVLFAFTQWVQKNAASLARYDHLNVEVLEFRVTNKLLMYLCLAKQAECTTLFMLDHEIDMGNKLFKTIPTMSQLDVFSTFSFLHCN